MEINLVPISDLIIPDTRQRREFNETALVELSESITRNGLLHPVVVRWETNRGLVLVAGERRIKAMDILWQTGQTFRCGMVECSEGFVPCVNVGELDPIDAFEAELDENIRRTDITWQERATAISQLEHLRQMQASRDEAPAPTPATLAMEVHGRSDGSYQDGIREQLIVARHLDDADVAGAGSIKEARKIIQRKEELKRSAALGIEVGKTFNAGMHRVIKGDCLEVMATLEPEAYDVILTDPPYGMDAQDFGDSGGKTPGAHFYDDSYESWKNMVSEMAIHFWRIAKPQAHSYVFCDIDNFHELAEAMELAGWKCFRTPLIWHNPGGMRAPWPEGGPQRKWQMVLYAQKGNRPVTRLYSDVLTYPSDRNLNHHAQKPVDLYRDLLGRSVRPGNRVIDPFCGSGTIFPACHELKCIGTGIELDPAAYGIAVKRLGELK